MTKQKISYFEKLKLRCEKTESSLCVGLDPDPRRIPKHLGMGAEAVYKFCVEIVEATADYAAAFKPNVAFFESLGPEGLHALQEALKSVPHDIPVILDAKRGDIDTTARHYARAAFDVMGADAMTVNPYLGIDSVEPFMKYSERGIYILCLTSNPGAMDFQLQQDLYLRVARKVKEWDKHGNLGLVVGATKPQFLTSILAVASDLPMLIPGLGAQGGDLEAVFSAAPKLPPHHLLFNVSRSIIFAANDSSFGREARVAAKNFATLIRQAREKSKESTQPGAEQKK